MSQFALTKKKKKYCIEFICQLVTYERKNYLSTCKAMLVPIYNVWLFQLLEHVKIFGINSIYVVHK